MHAASVTPQLCGTPNSDSSRGLIFLGFFLICISGDTEIKGGFEHCPDYISKKKKQDKKQAKDHEKHQPAFPITHFKIWIFVGDFICMRIHT